MCELAVWGDWLCVIYALSSRMEIIGAGVGVVYIELGQPDVGKCSVFTFKFRVALDKSSSSESSQS